MVNGCELLINVVIVNKPKALIGLDQKGKWAGLEAPRSSDADVVPPAERQHLTHSKVCKWNVVNP